MTTTSNLLVNRLEAAISAACPAVAGVAIGRRDDKATWRVDYTREPSAAELSAVQSAIDAFDASEAAQAAWEEGRQPERKAIRQDAAQAIADNNAFLTVASPNNAAVLAQVRALTRQNNRIMQRLIQID